MKFYPLLGVLLFTVSCKSYQAQPFDFPNAVDTRTRPIELQQKKVYAFPAKGVSADNLFDGARLNDFQHVEGDLFRASVAPENAPINPSPWYAFRLSSNVPQTIRVELDYQLHRHRYWPKISHNGKDWTRLDSSQFQLAPDSVNATLTLPLGSDTLWVAAQEVHNSTNVRSWCATKARHPSVTLSSIGESKMGRELLMLDIGKGPAHEKDVIVILSRQHPPEVTGYLAMQAFVDAVLADNPLANRFREKYRMLVFPLLNPDGVDLGHWRHNAGGIDLNRDWAYYHQTENRQIADGITRLVRSEKGSLVLGLDFHSTFRDVYYTNREVPTTLPHFKDYWLWAIRETLDTETNERPSFAGSPVSKNWFQTHFDAPGIVYEIGDSTPRDFISTKGAVSAIEMMKLLIFHR
ncbi:MAG: M14 family metallopeptidase [Bacteroidota bacterium]